MLALSGKFTLNNLNECISDIFHHENSHEGLCQIRPALFKPNWDMGHTCLHIL